MDEKLFTNLKNRLNSEDIKTWFDMGLLLDRIRDSRNLQLFIPSTVETFKSELGNGIAFITYEFNIDGVTIEIEKYSRIFRKIIQDAGCVDPAVYWMGSKFNFKQQKASEEIIFLPLPGARGFNDWEGYEMFFHTKLSRGSAAYNKLAKMVWDETVALSLQLGKYVIEKNIRLLIPVNVNSNPGNVPLAFSLVLVSEIMGIPVFNSNHDFYWEDGNHPTLNAVQGQRDHFFTNCHLGEVFSLIEVLYPWDSPLWFQSVINPLQRNKLINKLGFNPVSVQVISTFIDTEKFKPILLDQKREVLQKLHVFFGGNGKVLNPTPVDKYIETLDTEEINRTPLLLANSGKAQTVFNSPHILILQPTRILSRKQIEKNFVLIQAIFNHPVFSVFFKRNRKLKLILLVSGPISTGQYSYFKELVLNFKSLLNRLPGQFKNRVFLGFKFGLESTDRLIKRNLGAIKIEELFSTSDIVALPSHSEGRGLPIIESCACGTPVVANRYEPEIVFAFVIGEHLEKSKRLKVFEFPKQKSRLPKGLIEIYNEPELLSKLLLQNRKNVKKRYSSSALEKAFEHGLKILWNRCQTPHRSQLGCVEKAFQQYEKFTGYDQPFFQFVSAENRKYIPGIAPIEFMVILKSLIDPSYFRMEEKELKGRIMSFAQGMIKMYEKFNRINEREKLEFYNCVDLLFEFYQGEDKISMDHSLSYRHRHNRHYYFRKLTEYELRGLVAYFSQQKLPRSMVLPFNVRSSLVSEGIQSCLMRLVGFRKLAIDDSKRLIKNLESNRPFAWFPDSKWLYEIETFVVETLKFRLGWNSDEKISYETICEKEISKIEKVYLFIREKPLGNPIYYRNVILWLKNQTHSEVNALYRAGLFQIVKTEVFSDGTHLAQLGKKAKEVLLEIKKKSGFVVALGEANYLTSDLLDMESFRIGIARHPHFVHYLGIRGNEAYIQWVPAGLSPCLAYPTPIQSAFDFTVALKSKNYLKCVELFGEKKTLEYLRRDAGKSNSPVELVLKKMLAEEKNKERKSQLVKTEMLSGLHADGLPWSGVFARIRLPSEKKSKKELEFQTVFSQKTNETVLDLIKKYEHDNQRQVILAWNGGYILNPELVGKLGLPEKYIGSPLGLVIKNNVINSLPLYNKPAFVVHSDSTVSIERANLKNGLTISAPGGSKIIFTSEDRNREFSGRPVFYDLLYSKNEIPGTDRIIYRFAGNKIISIIKNSEQKVKILPVGLTVALPGNVEMSGWKMGAEMTFSIPGWENVLQAIEAGPMLVKDSKIAIDMKRGGWKTSNSISTQAARVDFENLRGPKIGVGTAADGQLIIVALNGRIRESVGCTHQELAKILIKFGCKDAMGFDPGGSVTLIVKGKQLNVSPYNKNYERSPYSLPPQARRVGNAILAVEEK